MHHMMKPAGLKALLPEVRYRRPQKTRHNSLYQILTSEYVSLGSRTPEASEVPAAERPQRRNLPPSRALVGSPIQVSVGHGGLRMSYSWYLRLRFRKASLPPSSNSHTCSRMPHMSSWEVRSWSSGREFSSGPTR